MSGKPVPSYKREIGAGFAVLAAVSFIVALCCCECCQPEITSVSVKYVGTTEATFIATLNFDKDVDSYGFAVSLDNNKEPAQARRIETGTSLAAENKLKYSHTESGLQPDTGYAVWAYAVVAGEPVFGPGRRFTTHSN